VGAGTQTQVELPDARRVQSGQKQLNNVHLFKLNLLRPKSVSIRSGAKVTYCFLGKVSCATLYSDYGSIHFYLKKSALQGGSTEIFP
jgi:hypothetical protein